MRPSTLNAPFLFSALSCAVATAAGQAAPASDTLEAIELDPLTVVSTGTGTDRFARDLPIRTELITPDLMLAAGVRDLAAALEYLPGVRTESNCQNCGTSEIKMLGLGASYNQLLFDGHPLFSGLASVYGIEQIPASSIGRIEVVKGGASTLYGPGAVAGVINILPNEPVVSKQRYDVSYESVHGQPFTSVSFLRDWSRENGDLALSVYGQFNDSDAVDLNDDGFSEITGKDFATIGANGWAYLTEAGKLSANYSYTWEKRRGGNALDLRPHESQITEQLEHRWHRGGLTWEGRLANDIDYRLSGSVSYVERDSYYGGVGDVALPGQSGYDATEYEEALDASRLLYGYSDTMRYSAESFFSKDIEKRTLSWGIQYQTDSVFDEKRDDLGRALRSDGSLADFAGQDPIVDGRFSNLGIFLQDEWMPNASTTLITGIRADKHSELEGWIYSPRIALRRTLSDRLTWRASISTGFRAPELFDEDLHIEILDNPTRTRNASNLAEERSVSYATGFAWTPNADNAALQIDGQVFRTEIDNAFHVPDIVYADAQGNAYKERVNAGGSAVQGFELNAAYRFSKNWSADTGVAYVDARFNDAHEVLPGIFEDRLLENPKWSGVAKLKYENEELFDLFVGLVYTGPMIAAREAEGVLNASTQEFFVVNLTATKHVHFDVGGNTLHTDFTIGVKNLFDERQPDLTSGPNRDTTYFYGPRFPRSYMAQVSVNW